MNPDRVQAREPNRSWSMCHVCPLGRDRCLPEPQIPNLEKWGMLTSKVCNEGQTRFGKGPLVILRPASYHSLLPASSQKSPLPPPAYLTDLGENLGSSLFSENPRAPGLALTFPGLGGCQSQASQPSAKGLPLSAVTSCPLHIYLDDLWHPAVHLDIQYL